MRLKVELFPQRMMKIADLPEGADGLTLMKSLGLAPDVHILVRDDIPIPIDTLLRQSDSLRIIAVVSGG